MESVQRVGERITQLEAQLSALRAPAPQRGFAAALNAEVSRRVAPATSAAATVAAPPQPRPSWASTAATGSAGSTAATAATGSTGSTDPATGTTSATATRGAPASSSSYSNGRLPASALQSIGHGSHQLTPAAAQAFQRLSADAARAGVTVGVTDSYRSYDAQVDVAKRKGLYSQGGLAAKPGTSNHGLGLSVDLDLDAAAQKWMRANGARYGFVEDVPREPWHWTYRP